MQMGGKLFPVKRKTPDKLSVYLEFSVPFIPYQEQIGDFRIGLFINLL